MPEVVYLEQETDFDLHDAELENSLIEHLCHQKESVKLSDEIAYFKEGDY